MALAARYSPPFYIVSNHKQKAKLFTHANVVHMPQVAVTDGSDYMLHVARVHARRRGWHGDVTPEAPAVETALLNSALPTGCTDVTSVTEGCGAESTTGHLPADCTQSCSRVFVAWFEACPAAASSPDLSGFYARCREIHGSGH